MTLAPLEVTASGRARRSSYATGTGASCGPASSPQGQHQQVIGLAPFDVTASNGSAVKVAFLGKSKGTVGDSSAAASKQFG